MQAEGICFAYARYYGANFLQDKNSNTNVGIKFQIVDCKRAIHHLIQDYFILTGHYCKRAGFVKYANFRGLTDRYIIG